MDSQGFETAEALVHSYAALAHEYQRRREYRKTVIPILDPQTTAAKDDHMENLLHCPALLILNAAILEGVLRTILTVQLHADIDAATTEGIRKGQTEPQKEERLLERLRHEVELTGGWDKLKEQYALYLNIPLTGLMSEDQKAAILALFSVRNVVVHGSAIIQAISKMSDDMKDIYPFKWQSSLQAASVLLEKEFSKGSLLENLKCFGVPEFFWKKTQEFLEVVKNHFSPLPKRAADTIEKVLGYRVGYMLSAK